LNEQTTVPFAGLAGISRPRRALFLLPLLAALAVLQFAPIDRFDAQWASEILQLALFLGAAAACVRAARRAEPGGGRRLWAGLAVSMGFWAAGQAFWASEAASFQFADTVRVWDALFLGSAFALVLLARGSLAGSVSSEDAFGLEALATILVCLHIPNYVAILAGSQPENLVLFLTTARQLAVLAVCLWMLGSAIGPLRVPVEDVGLALVCLYGGDAISSRAMLEGGYRAGLLDLAWTAPPLWIGLTAEAWTVTKGWADPPGSPLGMWIRPHRTAVLNFACWALAAAALLWARASLGQASSAREAVAPAAAASALAAGVFLAIRYRVLRSRVTQALRLLSGVVEQAADHVFITDVQGRILYANRAFLEHTGWRLEEVLGQTPRILKSGLQAPEFYAELWRRLRSGETFRGVLVNRKRDGTLYSADNTIAPILDPRGRVTHFVLTARDITERERALAGLRESERRYQQVLDTAQDAIMVDDVEGRVVFANERFWELLGLPRAAPGALRIEDYVTSEWRGILRDRHDRRVRGEAVPSEFEYEGLRADGQRFWIEVRVMPVVEAGRIVGTQSSMRDVTARHAAERLQAELRDEHLRAAEEWRATFDGVDMPILVLDPELVVTRCNVRARDLAGASEAWPVGQPLDDLVAGEPWAGMRRVARMVQAGERHAECHVVEEGLHWNVAASAVDHQALPGGIILLARDVTSVARLEEALLHSEALSSLGRLVAGVAHQVRNPLFALSAVVDSLVGEVEAGVEPALPEYGARLRRELDRLTVLMQDLLAYARPRREAPRRVWMHDVLPEAAAGGAALAAERGVLLDLESVQPAAAVDSDGRLVQAFQNLIENAVQHAPAGSAIHVGAFARDGWVECHVTDSGPGFSADEFERVFEPFYSRRPGGTGLGLAIVRRIVEEHQGVVQARNRTEGGGCVTVRLPLALDSDA
jgi:PAS domain S-box-containing protein